MQGDRFFDKMNELKRFNALHSAPTVIHTGNDNSEHERNYEALENIHEPLRFT